MVFPSYLFRLSQAIGLCNYKYVPERGRFKWDKGPMRIYCIVLHIIYVLLTPCAFSMMLHGYNDCQKLDMLAIAYSIVSTAKVASVVMLISSIWLLGPKRLRMLFGPPSIFMCEKLDGMRKEFAPLYVILSLGIALMEVLLTSADYWLYYLMHLSNRVLGFMSEETQEMRQDLNWLPQRSGSHRNWTNLLTCMEKLWFTLSALNFDPTRDTYGIALQRGSIDDRIECDVFKLLDYLI
ncbi:putative gustatory receptor 58c [Drosophila nasuta]|uniref:putative gustatory receptor 58c n=1 Tax=Drosophila nasuta TaxID=42062 RepID=UPI00295EA4B8|nr:putative gustatory receptor 58c [Drosophila nasuta]